MFWDYKYVLYKFLKVRLFDFTVIVRFVSLDMCIINQAKTTLAIIYDSVFSRLIAFDVKRYFIHWTESVTEDFTQRYLDWRLSVLYQASSAWPSFSSCPWKEKQSGDLKMYLSKLVGVRVDGWPLPWWKSQQVPRKMHVWVWVCMIVCLDGWVCVWVDGWVSDVGKRMTKSLWITVQLSEWVSGCTRRCLNR